MFKDDPKVLDDLSFRFNERDIVNLSALLGYLNSKDIAEALNNRMLPRNSQRTKLYGN